MQAKTHHYLFAATILLIFIISTLGFNTYTPKTPANDNWCDKPLRPGLEKLKEVKTSRTWFKVYDVGPPLVEVPVSAGSVATRPCPRQCINANAQTGKYCLLAILIMISSSQGLSPDDPAHANALTPMRKQEIIV